MSKPIYYFLLIAIVLIQLSVQAQSVKAKPESKGGWISVGGRSTMSFFSDDGNGIGTGGQFRIQFSNRVNTDWYLDYISINSNKIRSDYVHIGWSVLYYPFANLQYPKLLQPYILAGHCYDYNKKTVIDNPTISNDRLGSAVQAGLGTHFNLSDKFDVSLTCQYMIHLTKELEAEGEGADIQIITKQNATLEGHLLSTISFNYKLFRLWKRK